MPADIVLRIEAHSGSDTYARYHGLAVDAELPGEFWTVAPQFKIGVSLHDFTYTRTITAMADGEHTFAYGNSGYNWDSKIYINNQLVAAGVVSQGVNLVATITIGPSENTLSLQSNKSSAEVGEVITFSGRLLAPDGQPYMGTATIYLTKANIEVAQTENDVIGAYQFLWTPSEAGTFTMAAYALLPPDNIRVEAPALTITITEGPPPEVFVNIVGLVTDKPKGLPLPGVTVTVASSQGTAVRTTLPDGTYQVMNVPAGLYGVKFEKTGFGPVTSAVNATETGTYTVNAELVPGAQFPILPVALAGVGLAIGVGFVLSRKK